MIYPKKANAGTLFKTNTGKLTVGLQVVDVAMVKNESTDLNSPPFKLIQYKPGSNWNKTLCGLFLQHAATKSYYQGDINLGFGVMRVQLWKNEQPKSEKSPTIYITAQLLMEQPKNQDSVYGVPGTNFDAFSNTGTAQGYPIEYEGYNNNPGQNNNTHQTGNNGDDEIPF